MITMAQMIDKVAEKGDFTKKDTKAVIQALEAVVYDCVREGETVKVFNGVTIGVKDQPARNGVNPSTGEKIVIPAKCRVFAKLGKGLKDAANSK